MPPEFACNPVVTYTRGKRGITRVRWILFVIAAPIAVSGFIEPLVPSNDTVYNATAIPQALIRGLYYLWCKADAAASGMQPPPWKPLTVALFAPSTLSAISSLTRKELHARVANSAQTPIIYGATIV